MRRGVDRTAARTSSDAQIVTTTVTRSSIARIRQSTWWALWQNGDLAVSPLMSRLQGIPPVALDTPRTPILGSVPGAASMSAREYCMPPHEAFWRERLR